MSHRELAEHLIDAAGTGRMEFVDWPPDKKSIDIGDFYTDSSKFRRLTGWVPTVDLHEGLRRTVRWYLDNRDWWQAIQARGHKLERLGLSRASA